MGRWDNKNQNHRKGINNTKLLIVLVVFLVSFWVFYGLVVMMTTQPATCASIHEYIGSEDYFTLSNDERQKYLDVDRECNNINDIIVR